MKKSDNQNKNTGVDFEDAFQIHKSKRKSSEAGSQKNDQPNTGSPQFLKDIKSRKEQNIKQRKNSSEQKQRSQCCAKLKAARLKVEVFVNS